VTKAVESMVCKVKAFSSNFTPLRKEGGRVGRKEGRKEGSFYLCMAVYVCKSSTLGSWRQEDHEFKASIGYIVRPYLEKPKVENKF
jgi:hypothetical protein